MMSDLAAALLRRALEQEGRELERRLARVLFVDDLRPDELAERYAISRRIEVDGGAMRLVTTVERQSRAGS